MNLKQRHCLLFLFAASVACGVFFFFLRALPQASMSLGVYEAYRRGGNFYRGVDRAALHVDERWLAALLFERWRPALERDARARSFDPFEKALSSSWGVPDVFSLPVATRVGDRLGYEISPSYRMFLRDPWDDLLLRALYCDVYGYTPQDFQVLGRLVPDQGYTDTHVLLALLFLRENGCYDTPERERAMRSVVERVSQAAENDKEWSDLYSERIAFLYFAGEGERVKPEWIRRIVAAQERGGGFRDPLFGDEPNAHSTGLSLLVFRYFLEQAKEPSFFAPLDEKR